MALSRRSLSGATMGTRYSAVFYAQDTLSLEALDKALSAAVDAVDRQMSTWKPDSDLNRVNRAPIGEWTDVPSELETVLDCALRIGRRSGGAFNIGVGSDVEAWGFGPSRSRDGTTKHRSGKRAAAHDVLELRPGALRKLAPVSLDLSGIAKGFGTDELGRVLTKFGQRSWLVGIDGELRASGRKPDGEPWAVALERPDRKRRGAMGVLELDDRAVATSGTYRHWAEVGDRTISHTIDPATGEPIDNDLASATVLAKTCMEADAWATAFMVLGADAARRLARSEGIEALLVKTDGTLVQAD